MDNKQTESFVNGLWDDEIIPQLEDYIRIPNKSPHFDPDWGQHGHMEEAVQQLEAWCKTQPVKGMTVEIVRIEGRTPILFCDIPGDSDDVVLLYGHYDKQPEFSGWAEDLDPWVPTIKERGPSVRGKAGEVFATEFLGHIYREMIGQQQDVAVAFAQRRQRKHVESQPIEQVVAKLAVARKARQVFVGRSDQPHVAG